MKRIVGVTVDEALCAAELVGKAFMALSRAGKEGWVPATCARSPEETVVMEVHEAFDEHWHIVFKVH